jgi:hypothetical protein
VKHPKETFKKFKGAMKRKIFNLTSLSSSNNSGEDAMIAQLKETFQVTGKRSEILTFFHLQLVTCDLQIFRLKFVRMFCMATINTCIDV